jgi:hypothetical protein
VIHLIRTVDTLDWNRLLARFGAHWRVLFAHLVLFGFAYPDQRHRVPSWVMDTLIGRLNADRDDVLNQVCNGTILSREQYLEDIQNGRYEDGRQVPHGRMSAEELAIWTAAIPEAK